MATYFGWLIQDKILYQISTGDITKSEYLRLTAFGEEASNNVSHDDRVHIIADMAQVTSLPNIVTMNVSFDTRPGTWLFLIGMRNPVLRMLTSISAQLMKLPMKIMDDYPSAYQSLQRIDTSLYEQDRPALEAIRWLAHIDGDTVTPITTLPEDIL